MYYGSFYNCRESFTHASELSEDNYEHTNNYSNSIRYSSNNSSNSNYSSHNSSSSFSGWFGIDTAVTTTTTAERRNNNNNSNSNSSSSSSGVSARVCECGCGRRVKEVELSDVSAVVSAVGVVASVRRPALVYRADNAAEVLREALCESVWGNNAGE